ncbi:putative reverse transcriptase domain-containing protein [Tanacetum coccineum]
MDFYLYSDDQISLGCFQAFHCDAIMGQMLYQFQGNQRDYFSNDTFRGRSLVSSAVYYEVTLSDILLLRHIFGGVTAAPKESGCFECGALGHFKRDCPKFKNKDGGNGNAQGWVYAVGNAEKRGNASGNLDSNVVTGTFLLNNHYASIFFDTGADRSFISTALVL